MTAREKDKLLRKDQVVTLTGLPKSALNRFIKLGQFLEPIMILPRQPRWREREVLAWMAGQYSPATSLIDPPPAVPAGRRRFIHEGLLCTQAPEHDGVIRSATKLSRHVVRVDDLSFRLSGIYFLWRGPTIVYVGQSRTGFARIAQHINEGYKKFDGVSFVRCPADRLDEVERQYIDAFLPEYNADGITLAMKRLRTLAARAHKLPDEDPQ